MRISNILRIGTWNLQCAKGAQKNARRRRAIQDVGADIWVLTETHDDVDLGPDFEPVRSGDADILIAPKLLRQGSNWTTIWTRFPILQELPVVDPQRSAAALLDAPCGPLLVYGTVLPWPGSKPPFRDAVKAQAADWLALKRAHPGAVFCVAGDLNADMVDGAGFPGKIGIQALHEAMEPCGLYCATLPPPGAAKRIDHVLLPEEWRGTANVAARLAGAAPNGVRLSDHDGVVVEVAL